MRISDWSSDVCSSDLIDAFRGFALADPIAPFVVINDRDAKTAWSFTLLHEVAHLWIGATGVSGGHFEGSTEQFCNDVASRSEERREGKEGVSTCRSRWSPFT